MTERILLRSFYKADNTLIENYIYLYRTVLSALIQQYMEFYRDGIQIINAEFRGCVLHGNVRA